MRRRPFGALAATALGLALLLVAGRSHANPIDAYGFGSRAPALAGAVSADVEDGSASYYNPAGLVRGDDLRIDIGYGAAVPSLKINGRDLEVDASHGLALGIVAPARIGPVKFAFGALVWMPDQRVTRTRSLPFDQPRFVLYDNLPQRIIFSANLALQLTRSLFLGGGLTFMSRTTGSASLRGTIELGDAEASQLESAIDVNLASVRYPQAGLLWRVSRLLSLSVVYRHSYLLTSDLAFRIDGNIGNPALVEGGYLRVQTRTTDLFQPWQLVAGAAFKLRHDIELLFDLTYARWSEFPVAAGGFELDLDVKQFQPLVKLAPPQSYPPSGFRDVVTPRLGVEVALLDRDRLGLDLRGGYSYSPTPVPEQIGLSSLADSDKHTFSVGAGLELRRLAPILSRPLTFDLHLAVTALPPRDNRKLLPVDKVGDFVASGAVVNLGLSMKVRF
jgi:long-chain fatty acid transport protein